ncbi:MAG: glycosyltransferase family 2 protein, partial [Candidatus Heimdallarchaeota archaeon]
MSDVDHVELSIVIPIYNEEKNIEKLIVEIVESVTEPVIEIICVNDRSTDNSLEVLYSLSKKFKDIDRVDLVAVDLRRNSGQTAAMRAGFSIASGKYVVTMDGDGQNDPSDIPKLYDRISNEKVDVICGWRKNRKDPLSKRIPSKISNYLHRKLTGLNIHDSGCSLRIYISEAVKELPIH